MNDGTTGTVSVTVDDELAYVTSPEYTTVSTCAPASVEVKLYVADPAESVSVVMVVPVLYLSVTVTTPVGTAVDVLAPEATLMETASAAPDAGVAVAAESVVVEATAPAGTVSVIDPVEDA